MGKRRERRWRLPELTTKAKVIFGLVVFVFVAAIATFVVTTILRQQSLAGSKTDYGFAKMDAEARQKDARNSAAKALTSGDGNEAEAIYRQAIAVEPDGTKKVLLAIDYSGSLTYSDQSEKALSIANEAEAYSDDKYLIYDWYARLYNSMKRYRDAAEYYEKAGALTSSPTNVGKYSKDYYDERAAAMKAEVSR
mgnify:CR=1 FL=1